MAPRQKKEKFQHLTVFERNRSQKRRPLLSRSSSLCAAEQLHSDAGLKAVDRRAPNSSRKLAEATGGDISVLRPSPAPHDGEWPYSILQAIDSKLVYCYKCTYVGFISSSISAA